MVKNACMDPTCSQYLIPDTYHRVHYNSYVPVRYTIFKIVKNLKDESLNKILSHCANHAHKSIRKFAAKQPDDL